MNKQARCSIVVLFLCVWMMFVSAGGAAAAVPEAGGGMLLRVAIPIPTAGAGDGTSAAYTGYTEEYLHEISQYTGWQYEIIPVPGDYATGLGAALDLLRDGSVDLVAPVALGGRDPEPGICYAQCSFLTTAVELQVPNEVYDGAELAASTRVAVISGSGLQPAADAFFARNGIEPRYVVCRSVSEQMELVCSGQADVMLNATLEYIPDTSVIASFSPEELYFAASDRALMQQLDSAHTDMMQSNVLFTQELYAKYIIDSSQTLTLEEKAFIARAQPYVVAVVEDRAPYQYVDPQTGEYRGIGIDLLHEIAEQTGLRFSFVRAESWEDVAELLESGAAQLVAEMPYDQDLAVCRNLTRSRGYAASPYVLVSRPSFSGPDAGARVALPEPGSSTEEDMVGQVHRYPTVRDCIEAVRSGQADYTCMDLNTVQYYMADPRYSGLEFTAQSYTPHTVCFGLAKPTQPELRSILNKAINQLSDTGIQQIIRRNSLPQQERTILYVLYSYPLQVLMVIIAVALMIAALLLLLLWRKEKVRRALHKKSMEDGLTQLYNAAACRKLITQKLRRMQPGQVGAFLIMDMDNFKEVNDSFGHQEGDRVIREFANLLCDVLRGDSVIARIGGDEFVAFFSSVKAEENIGLICGRICTQARSIRAGERGITISIGAVKAVPGDDYDTLYRLSDQALYQVKKKEKDAFCLLERER